MRATLGTSMEIQENQESLGSGFGPAGTSSGCSSVRCYSLLGLAGAFRRSGGGEQAGLRVRASIPLCRKPFVLSVGVHARRLRIHAPGFSEVFRAPMMPLSEDLARPGPLTGGVSAAAAPGEGDRVIAGSPGRKPENRR
jgi:hypothetical protein